MPGRGPNFSMLKRSCGDPGISSFGSGSSAENTGQCELSSVEVSMVQSVMQQRNASCSYNMTLESILAVIP